MCSSAALRSNASKKSVFQTQPSIMLHQFHEVHGCPPSATATIARARRALTQVSDREAMAKIALTIALDSAEARCVGERPSRPQAAAFPKKKSPCCIGASLI